MSLEQFYQQLARSPAAHALRAIRDPAQDCENAWATSRRIFEWYARTLARDRPERLRQITAAVILSARASQPDLVLNQWREYARYPQDFGTSGGLVQVAQLDATRAASALGLTTQFTSAPTML